MFVFIAGAISTGQVIANTVVVNISSAIPAANFAITFAVAGAITQSDAFFASDICSTSNVFLGANISTLTGFDDNVSKVVMNFKGVEFMGRSFAQEYLNQKNKAPFEIVEINVPNEVQNMFNIILKLNGHL